MKQTNLKKQELLDILTSAIVVLGKDLQVLYMNQSAEMLFSQSKNRVAGLTFKRLLHNHEFMCDLELAMTQQIPQSLRERVIELSHGEQITVDCVVTPLDGQGWGQCLLLELQRVDRQLRIVREEQVMHQQKAAAELVRGLAHEIKNPLGGLRGAAQLLESELDSAELREYTQIIISEADRLKHLVNSMLGPRILSSPERVNIHEVLEHVRQLVNVDSATDLQFITDYDPSIPEFEGNRDQLVQVVLNIVSNAIRVLAGNGIIRLRTRILRQFTIQQTRYRHVVKADVCDNGPGVPEALRDKLFLPMVSGHAEGSGLGLAIAQSLIGRHNGIIQYESVPGNTCFSMLIPLENVEP